MVKQWKKEGKFTNLSEFAKKLMLLEAKRRGLNCNFGGNPFHKKNAVSAQFKMRKIRPFDPSSVCPL